MKLQELESKTKVQQSLKVFESYFGKSLSVNTLSPKQAAGMLRKVRGLISEHRATPEFHRSERNPTYLKLMVMEQALSARIKETSAGAVAGMDANLAKGVAKVATATGQGGQSQRLTKAIQSTLAGKTLDSASKAALAQHEVGIANLMKDPSQATRLQQMLKQASSKQASANAMGESKRLRRRLKEASDLQQAQVVLAAQDMVDQMQKMIEQVSSMQFKDLPALVDSIRNDVGMDQAQKFNNDVTASLQGLIQSLQGSKTQLEAAQGVLTGAAPVVPGQDAGAMPAPVPGLDVPGGEGDAEGGDLEADLALDANVDVDAEELPPAKALGRERR